MRKLIKSAGFKRYFTNTSWLLVDNAANLAIAFVVGIFIARYLGPTDYGLLNFAKTVAKFFSVTCALGLERIVIRNLLREENDHGRIMGTAWGLKATTSVAALAVLASVGFWIFEDTRTYLLILCFTAVSIFESFVVVRYYFQSKVQSRLISRMVLIKIMVSSTVKITLIYFQMPLIYFAFEALLEGIIGMIGYWIVFSQKADVPFSRWRFDKSYGRQLLKDAWPLLVSSFVVYIYMETDIIIIKYLLGSEAVGFYAVAARITTICYLGGTIICNSLFPAILQAKSRDEEMFRDRFTKLLRLLVLLSAAICAVVFIGAPFTIIWLFGESYAQAIPSLQVLILSIIFVYLGVAGSQWYIAHNMQKVLLTRTALGAAVNIILNVLLIPVYGILGAAVATLVAQVTASFLGNLLSARTRELFRLQLKALIFAR